MSTAENGRLTPDLKSFAPSVVRTLTPVVVAYLAGFPVAKLLGLDDDHVTALVTSVLYTVYYLAVRVLERFVAPRFGWLLGYASAPVYVAPTEAGATRSPVGDVKRVTREQDQGR